MSIYQAIDYSFTYFNSLVSQVLNSLVSLFSIPFSSTFNYWCNPLFGIIVLIVIVFFLYLFKFLRR